MVIMLEFKTSLMSKLKRTIMRGKLLKRGIIICMFFLLMVGFQSITVNAKATLKAPQKVTVARHSNTELRLKWSKVDGADGYIIYKYNKVEKAYKKHKTIDNKKAILFIDKIGERKSANYKVSAYQKVGKKKLAGTQSYSVQARTYRQGDKKVNAGQIKAKIKGRPYYEKAMTDSSYYETIKLSATMKPSKYSKTTDKKALNEKIRWYSSSPNIAAVNKDGLVKAKAKKGKCYVYAVAHNGNRSNKIAINVKNYAKPPKNSLQLGAALNDSDGYGFVLSMFYEDYEAVTDIAEYFYINRPKKNETFRCEMIDGEIVMFPANYPSGGIKQKVYNFVKDFPYEVRVDVTSGGVTFVDLSGLGQFGGVVTRVEFRYNKNTTSHLPYTKKYEPAENWTYGYFNAI